MLDASPSLLWAFLSRFQSPSRCSKDGASADRVSSEQSTLHPRIESPERAKGVRSDSIIKKRDKNMSTETSPLVLLMNQGTAALSRCRECQSTAKTETLPLSDRHRAERLPESSAERFRRQSSEFPHRGNENQLESLCATTVDGVVGVCILWRSTDSVVWVLKKAFQKTWPYCRNGHHFTVQHLRFSVEESAGPALLETVMVY